uniref:Cyclin-dependent kinases regulatory subunit n=1 Tax=Rhinolophus ferrumequinum TaxID=59479 RepID=A0A671FNN7_RHIFE
VAQKQIYSSDMYFDEYRHVMLLRELSKQVPKTHVMSEEKWRRLCPIESRLGSSHDSRAGTTYSSL